MRTVFIAFVACLAAASAAASARQDAPPAPGAGIPRGASVAPTPVPAPAQAAPQVKAGEGYRLGPNDEIEISIFSGQNQVVKTRVKEDGTVTVPYLGPMPARDLTARELATRIAGRLKGGGYFVDPIVNVDVTQFVSNVVTVLGNVGTPGIYPIDRDMTMSMLIARAGGSRGDGADYAMLRRGSEAEQHRITFDEISGEWNGATRVISGDTVYVPPQPIFFAYGQVNSPGAFPIKSGMTIRQALARAGGPTLAGSQRSVTIYRGKEKMKKVDLDQEVQPDDTIYVNERFF